MPITGTLRVVDNKPSDGLTPIERVLPKLQKVKKCGTGWAAQCPAHEDRNPSLTVGVGKDGRVLLNCHKGCTYSSIMAALGLKDSDGFPTEETDAPRPLPQPRGIIATYDYTDETGQPLFQTVRYVPKDFRQRHADANGEWVWSLNGIRRVLYRLPELVAAEPDLMVFLVEGEKDADALAAHGFVATTSPMGADNWKPEYAEFLRGRHVVVVPDNDTKGYSYAAKAIISLRGVAASVRRLILPDLAIKGDVSDWLAAGHTANEFAALAEAAPDVTSETSETTEIPADDPFAETEEPVRFVLHWAREALLPQPPIDWIVQELFSTGSVSLLVGAPGTKKTYTALDMAVCIALGRPWLGRTVKQGAVLLIDEESGLRRLNRRLNEVMRAHNAGEDTAIAYTSLAMMNFLKEDDVEQIDRLLGRVQPMLVIIDALADVMPGADENAVKDTHPVFQTFRRLAERFQCAILVIHHANKMGTYRGSTAMPGAVDLMIMVESHKDSIEIKYSTEKVRDTGPQVFGAAINFNPLNGSVMLTGETPAPAPEKRRSLSQRYVLDYIETAGGRAWLVDIKAHVDRCSEAAAEKATHTLVDEGLLRRCDGGKMGEKAMYELIGHTAETPEEPLKVQKFQQANL